MMIRARHPVGRGNLIFHRFSRLHSSCKATQLILSLSLYSQLRHFHFFLFCLGLASITAHPCLSYS